MRDVLPAVFREQLEKYKSQKVDYLTYRQAKATRFYKEAKKKVET